MQSTIQHLSELRMLYLIAERYSKTAFDQTITLLAVYLSIFQDPFAIWSQLIYVTKFMAKSDLSQKIKFKNIFSVSIILGLIFL